MKTIMARTPHESSFSFSRRYFHWKKKVEDDEVDVEEILNFSSCYEELEEQEEEEDPNNLPILSLSAPAAKPPRKKLPIVSVSKLRSALTFGKSGRSRASSGIKLVGTLFGHRRGHVHFAFQENPKLSPAFLVELAMPTSVLVREMASGLVRIALECEKKQQRTEEKKKGAVRLLEEPQWRTYCNGKKFGYANRRECGPEEWKVLNAVGPISMGAGVLPGSGKSGGGFEGELMYMRAKFERVVGSKDSEAFYMMNPDGNGGPELSIYLLRV